MSCHESVRFFRNPGDASMMMESSIKSSARTILSTEVVFADESRKSNDMTITTKKEENIISRFDCLKLQQKLSFPFAEVIVNFNMASSQVMLYILSVLLFRSASGFTQYDINRETFGSFMDKYGDDLLQSSADHFTSPVYPLINSLTAIKNWGITSDLNLPAASEYPYFRWIPMYGNASIPSKLFIERHHVTFDPLHCFDSGSMWTEYNEDDTSHITIHLELFNKSSFGCRCLLLFATANHVAINEFFDPGPHKIKFPVNWTTLSEPDQYDLERKGVRVLTMLGDLAQSVADVTETASLFECFVTKRDLKMCEKHSLKFMKDYAGIEMTKRGEKVNEVWKDINESLIQSGDFFGVIRLDGLDPVLGM